LAFLSLLFLIATTVVGCGGSSKHPDGGSGGPTGTGGTSGNPDGAQSVQYFILSWSIVDVFDQTTTCGQAAAGAVRVTVDSTQFRFDCFSGGGMTGVVPPGSHTLNAELLMNSSDSVLSTDGPLTTTLDANVPKTLPGIVFYLN
jgi:hypothetical protein